MAAGVKNGKFTITDTESVLGTILDGVTYSHLEVRLLSGVVFMGDAGSVNPANGFTIPEQAPIVIEVAATAADIAFIGNGVIGIFGIATA